MKSRRGTFTLLFAVFAVNFLSLVYQIIWTRRMMVVFGSTALSISTVLTVFLSGIALGGYLGGVWLKRFKDGYRLLGLSLIVLGAYCLSTVYLFGLITYPFHFFTGIIESPAVLNLLKLLFCFIILIVPTTIIGSVFPIATHLYSEEFKMLGRDVASIYFLDTLGATIGALVCGFFLIPAVGLKETSFSSALIYVVLGIVILAASKGRLKESCVKAAMGEGDSLDALRRPASDKGFDAVRSLVLLALFFSGFAALLLEVVWSRYFHLIFGTSIYAFTLVVSAFLLGLSIGSFLVKRVLDRLKNPLMLFAYIEVLIAGFSLIIIKSSSWMEMLYFKLFHSMENFYAFQSILFIIAFLSMLIPASLMGANFPLAVRIFSRSASTRGKDAGLAFSINTGGGIIGAFAAGFVVIPLFGLNKTNLLASAIYFAIGLVFIRLSARRVFVHYLAVLGIGGVFLGAGYFYGGEPPLNYSVYYGGIMHNTLEEFLVAKNKKEKEVLSSKQGYYGLVSVTYDPDNRVIELLNNGKTDASTYRGDTGTQLLLGHLPLFFHDAPEKILNIGLGGGFTLGAIESHPEVESIDVVEIDPLVVEATARFFKPYNNDALSDARVRMHIQDGRHYLATTRNKFDVVISEPPNIWVSGVSQLFTSEFYRIVDEHLETGGVLAQWVPAYELSASDLKLILKTVKGSFENVTFWTNRSDIVILASHRKPRIDPARVASLMSVRRIIDEMEKIIPDADHVLVVDYLLRPDVEFEYMDYYLYGFGLVNTDNLPRLEFSSARNTFNLIKLAKERRGR